MRQDSPGSIDARTERGQQTIIVESPLGKNGALILWASAVMGAISIVSIIATVLLFSDGLGNTSYGFPLPAANSMAGLPITGQTVDLDSNLPFGVPIGSSQGLQITIGN